MNTNLEKVKKQMLAYCEQKMNQMECAPKSLKKHMGYVCHIDYGYRYDITDNPIFNYCEYCSIRVQSDDDWYDEEAIIAYPITGKLYYVDSDELYVYHGISDTEAELLKFNFNTEESVYEHYDINGLFNCLKENMTWLEVSAIDSDWIYDHYTEKRMLLGGGIAEFNRIFNRKIKIPLNEDLSNMIMDFIYKVEDSNKLFTVLSDDNILIDEFMDEDQIDAKICFADTKKDFMSVVKNFDAFNLKVNITLEDGSYNRTIAINSKDVFNKTITDVIEVLNQDENLARYTDDLESCI